MRPRRKPNPCLGLAALTLLLPLCASTAAADRLTSLAIKLTEPAPATLAQVSPEEPTAPERTLLAPTESLRSDARPLGGAPEAQQPLPAAAANDSSWWLLETSAALGCVIALIFAARWGYQKLSGHQLPAARASATVEVLSRTTVAPRSQVLLLRVAGRVLICADSPHGMNCLSEITDPDEVAAILGRTARDPDTLPSNAFQDVLASLENDDEDDDTQHEPSLDRAREDLSKLLARVRNRSAVTAPHNPRSQPKDGRGLGEAGDLGAAGGWVA